MSRGGRGFSGGRGGELNHTDFEKVCHTHNFIPLHVGRGGFGGGRGGYQQRDMGPPDVVLGSSYSFSLPQPIRSPVSS